MPTIKDVAKKAKVSVATVSRVLNGTAKVSDKAKHAVLKAQKELGFVLNANAKALAQKDSETIGVLVADVSDPFFGVMVKACEDVAHSIRKILLVTQGFDDQEREIRGINSLISHQCSSLVIYAQATPDDVLTRYMQAFPYMVLLNRVLPGYEERCINVNNVQGMYSGVKYLIDSGHRRIAYVNSAHNITDAINRRQGFMQALQEAGIDVDDRLMVTVPPSMEGGSMAAEYLLRYQDEFTAVVCYNDALAVSIIASFAAAGIAVPEKVSVTGFDNLFFSSCIIPTLTTISNPVETMAKTATELSIALYRKEHFVVPEFKTELIVRNSVRPLV